MDTAEAVMAASPPTRTTWNSTVTPPTPLNELAEERMVGNVSERDLLRAMADGVDPRATPVSAHMTSHPFTISPDAEATEAAQRMVQWWVRHLPVVHEGHVIGDRIRARPPRPRAFTDVR
jgi:CBS domain-containing protein